MGKLEVEPYLIDVLMPDLIGHDRQPSAFIVYLFLWRQSRGKGAATIQVSLFDIAIGTGLSKRSCQDALRTLSKRKLVSIERESITAIPIYTVLGRR